MKKKPRLIICIGTQKAGTSWLNNYLTRQNNLCFNYKNQKELHLWNSYLTKNRKYRISQAKSSFKNLLNYENFSLRKFKYFYDQLNFLINTYYPRRFLNNASRECESRNIPMCDFTPNYCVLDSKFLNKMKIQIEEFFDLKIIFLMRDPVQRIYSWIKHSKRIDYGYTYEKFNKNNRNNIPDDFYNNIVENFLIINKPFNKSFHIKASNYPQIIDNLNSNFAKNQVKTVYYEKLFTLNSIKSICNFLDIEFKTPNFSKFVNQDTKKEKISLEQHTLLLNQTRHIYEEMHLRYKDVPSEWGKFK